jgi:chemotaxis regulatin CheY-phosphate phosphatase CheZ
MPSSPSPRPGEPMAARHEVYYDTEAALRLVDHELSAREAEAPDAAPAPAPAKAVGPSSDTVGADAAHHLRALLSQPEGKPVGLAALPFILERATVEIQNVLANLRDSREALESATVEKIQHTSEKLKEVTSATEVAATDILDALDRAQNHIDDLDAADEAGDREKGRNTRDLLREEIFGMMGCLQFQDITTQQLSYAASVLTDMESRLLSIAKLFDPASALVRAATHVPDPLTFDPNATVKHAEQRQALADEIFQVAR